MTNRLSSRRVFVRSVAGASLLPLADKPGLAKEPLPSSIFLATDASPSERWAASELRAHIAQMTGTHLPIDTGADVLSSRRVIAVGQSAFTDRLGIEPPTGESCLLKTVGETVVIAGGRHRGTMYGVAIFLERLGCRWFTADIARIPRSSALRLPELNEVHRPAFEYREVFFTEAQSKDWSARNRLNGHFHKLDDSVGGKVVYMPFAHAYYDLVPPDRWFDTHPEYFAFVQGRRRKVNAQLCLTNADVLRLAVEQAGQWLAANPEISIVSISQNDGAGWCECGPCRQVIREEGAIAGLALRFVNQVAERLAVSHPGKIVDMLAYQDTADPPSSARPLPNVQIRFCPIDACQAHSFQTCVYNRPIHDRLAQWSRIAPRLHVWQYSVNFSHFLAPFPNYDELVSDIPAFHRAGVSGLFIEGAVSDGGGGDDAELRSYLAARLLWNPDLDAAAEIRDFLNAVYGPVSPLMRTYFDLRQHEVRRGQHLWIDQNVDARYLTPDFLKRGRALLSRASLKASDQVARRRIGRHLLSLDYLETIRKKRCVLQGASYGPSDPARVRDDTQKFVTAAAALGLTHLREGYPMAQQSRDWGDPAFSYKAVALTGGVTVVPELGARVIAFGPTNILRVPDPGELAYPHGGGIYVGLSDGYLTTLRPIAWQLTSSMPDTVTLTGKSDSGHDLQLKIAMVGAALRLRVTVVNRSDSTARLVLLCRAEFACRPDLEAMLRFRDRSGTKRERKIQGASGNSALTNDDLPQREWTLAGRVTNRFPAEEVARCNFNWWFRDAGGLNVTMSLVSPEVDLPPAQQLTLTSEYELV